MVHHVYAEGLVQEHPAIERLVPYFKTQRISRATIEFLRSRTFFAYPRTLWIKLAVNVEDDSAKRDISSRHSLDPEKTGEALGAWLRAKPSINKIVFDLTDFTIFDVQRMLGLFRATGAECGGAKYYVCDGEIAESLRSFLKREDGTIFESEAEMLQHLRAVSPEGRCVVNLPRILDLLSLDEALRVCAPPQQLRRHDVIAFDMSDVMSVSFDAHSMLSPIIHSVSHRYGILATVVNARPKVLSGIMAHGSLRPMRSNLIQVDQEYLKRLDPPACERGIFSMRTFTRGESVQVQALCMRRLYDMVQYYSAWFADVEKIRKGLGGRATDRFKPLLEHLRNVIQELVDNVAGHASGLGY